MFKNFGKLFLSLLLVFIVFGAIKSSTVSAAQAFIKPSPGTITSPFGNRTGGFHYGIDIAQSGTVSIVASAGGTVTKSTTHATLGEYIIVRHSIAGKTYDTLYAHMRPGSRLVGVGATVQQGQKLGTMGETGNAKGQHLHFEMHVGGYAGNSSAVDPAPYINGQINPQEPHTYDNTWATVEIINTSGGSTANLFGHVGYGIIGTLPVGGKYKVYGQPEKAANGDIYYNVGPGYIYSGNGKIFNHHATVNGTINTYKSPNGAFNRTLSAGTYKVHGAKDGWYDLGNNTWVNSTSVVVTKQ